MDRATGSKAEVEMTLILTEDDVTRFVLDNFDEVLVSDPFGKFVVLARQLSQDQTVNPYNLFMDWTDCILRNPFYDGEYKN